MQIKQRQRIKLWTRLVLLSLATVGMFAGTYYIHTGDVFWIWLATALFALEGINCILGMIKAVLDYRLGRLIEKRIHDTLQRVIAGDNVDFDTLLKSVVEEAAKGDSNAN